MKFAYKSALLASALVGMQIAAHAQDNNTVRDSSSAGKNRFDVSSNACYNRMTALDEISRNNFQPSDSARLALRNVNSDDVIFDVPVNEWNDAVVSEFNSALTVCMEPEGMQRMWSDAFVERLRARFPDYLAEARRRFDRAARFNEESAGDSGIAASCPKLVSYAVAGIKPTTSGEKNSAFGKALTGYTQADYRFLDHKIDNCTTILREAGHDDNGGGQEIEQLATLQKEISTEWPDMQRGLVPQEQAATVARAEAADVAANDERRKTEPTLLERIGDYIMKAGFVGVALGIATMGKKDARAKNGYKGNWQMSKPMRIIGLCSVSMVLLGWLIGL